MVFGSKSRLLLLWCLAVAVSSACRRGEESAKTLQKGLTVAAASNVQYAMEELIREFEAETNIEVQTVVSSSGKLSAQISQGAPYDVFVSADEKYPAEIARSGLAAGPPEVYAYGHLVLWTVRQDIDLSPGLSVLNARAISKIAVANPDLAPYGEQSMRVLRHLGLEDRLRTKLVFGENISQTSQYIMSGACDVGFTAKSVVLASQLAGKGRWMEVPGESYSPIAQAAVRTRSGAARRPEESKKFFAFLFSRKAREILREYGYGVPGDK